MAGTLFHTDSKCGGECDGHKEVDRISKLPDDIIIFILSFLSLRDAIATSVLSSRWPDLWKYIPNLHFNRIKRAIRTPREFRSREMVDSVLRSHKSLLIKDLTISLDLGKSAQGTVSKWFEFFITRQVERLDWDLFCEIDMDKVVLSDILRDNKVLLSQTDAILFKSLKRLFLSGFKVSGEDIDLFLRNCPRLEFLSIRYSVLTSDVVVSGTTLVLRALDLYFCSGKISIKVSAPKLEWLRIYTREEKELLLENLPRLVKANFIYYAKHYASLFCCIPRLKFLILTLPLPKVFLMHGFPQMPKLKTLELVYHGSYGLGLLPVTAFIWASPVS